MAGRMMMIPSFTNALLALSTAAASAVAYADGEVKIRGINTGGSGCQRGTVSSSISPDARAFSLIFDHYQAQVGAGMGRRDQKSCVIDIEFAIPAGWQFALFSADYRGFASADQNAVVMYEVFYSFDRSRPLLDDIESPEGGPKRPGPRLRNSRRMSKARFSFSQQEFVGPFSDSFSFHNELAEQDRAWSSCEDGHYQTVRISSSLAAVVTPNKRGPAAPAQALITLDSVDGALSQNFGLQWRKCGSDENAESPGSIENPGNADPWPTRPGKKGPRRF